MNLEEALKRIQELEKKNAILEAKLFKTNKKYQEALLEILTLKEKKKIIQSKPFIRKTEKIKKCVEIDEADVLTKKKKTINRKKKYEEINFESLVSEIREINPDETICPKCGETLIKVNEKIRYVVEAIETKIKVVKIIKNSFKCPTCNKEDNKLYYPLSNEVFSGSILTPSFAAYLCYMKYELGIPFYHLESHFKNNLNLPISSSNMADYMERVSNRLLPIYKKMKEDLLNNSFKVIHADETTLEVKRKEDKIRKKSYIYVYSSSFYQDKQIQIYEFNESRSPIKLGEWLKEYDGFIICDDYSGYDKIRKENKNIKLQRCWVHAKRKFMDIIKNIPQEKRKSSTAYKIASIIGELFEKEVKIREKNLNPLDIVDYRKKHSLPIVNKLKDAIESTAIKKGSALEDAIKYIKKIWNDLIPYLSNGYLEMTNNTAERAVRPFVMLRKQFISVGSNKGGEITSTIFSIIRTAMINGLDVTKYLTYTLKNLNENNIDELLPYSKTMINQFS